jgi:hypothetical protein
MEQNRAHGNLSVHFTTASTAVGVNTIFFMKEERRWSNSNLVVGVVVVIIICLPDRAIMSACDRLLAANSVVSWSRSNDGGGSFPSTLVDSETSPSSLPSSTAYDGPPACTDRERYAREPQIMPRKLCALRRGILKSSGPLQV